METPQRETDDKGQKATFHQFKDYGIFKPCKFTPKAPDTVRREGNPIKAPTKLI